MTAIHEMVKWLDNRDAHSGKMRRAELRYIRTKAHELLANERSLHRVEAEPLDKLAERKGFFVEQCAVALMTEGYKNYERYYGDTPAAAEQAARDYLNGLADKEGGVK